MEYDINLNTLASKQTELETLKTTAEDTYNEFNSCYLNGLNGELSSLKTIIKSPIERAKKGITNSSNWYKKYVKELQELEAKIAEFNVLTKPTEFKGEFLDLFGKTTMPILKTGAQTKKQEGTIIAGPASTDALRTITVDGQEFYVTNTRIPLEEYEAYIRKYKMYQDSGFLGGNCMLLSQYYASDMIRGQYTKKQTMYDHGGSPAVKMNQRCKSSNSDDVLRYVFDEINAGYPVVLQVSQKKSDRGARHLVTMVGYTKDVKRWEDLNPNNILVLDCYDGKVQTLGKARSEGGHERRLYAQGGKFQALGPTEKFLASIS